MTDLRKLLAFNMKFYRKKMSLSQAKLADLVDASENHIALIETGRRFPSISMLEMLATALEIDVLQLFSKETIELYERKSLKKQILADIDNILTIRLE